MKYLLVVMVCLFALVGCDKISVSNPTYQKFQSSNQIVEIWYTTESYIKAQRTDRKTGKKFVEYGLARISHDEYKPVEEKKDSTVIVRYQITNTALIERVYSINNPDDVSYGEWALVDSK